MKIIKSFGTYIKEQTNIPNLTYKLHAICKLKKIRHSQLKTVGDVWRVLDGYGFDHDYLFLLCRELLSAERGFESQYLADFDPTQDF